MQNSVTAESQQSELGKRHSSTYTMHLQREGNLRRKESKGSNAQLAGASPAQFLGIRLWTPGRYSTQSSPHRGAVSSGWSHWSHHGQGHPGKSTPGKMQEGVGCTLYQANAPPASAKSTSAIQRTGSVGSNAKAVFAWLEESDYTLYQQ